MLLKYCARYGYEHLSFSEICVQRRNIPRFSGLKRLRTWTQKFFGNINKAAYRTVPDQQSSLQTSRIDAKLTSRPFPKRLLQSLSELGEHCEEGMCLRVGVFSQ